MNLCLYHFFMTLFVYSLLPEFPLRVLCVSVVNIPQERKL
jgi:hypothetical protein